MNENMQIFILRFSAMTLRNTEIENQQENVVFVNTGILGKFI